MAYSDFIQVKRLRGELLLSQKRNRWGCTLTTKELIFQKPHISYHLLLDDIIGIVPFRPKRRTRGEGWNDQWENPDLSSSTYKITASRLTIIRRNGAVRRGQTDLILPLNQRFLRYFQKHTDFTALPTDVLL
ncbi:MAG: hypothetical protein AB2404_13965 [Planifilum fimeticola]|jgi:hypothetical protein